MLGGGSAVLRKSLIVAEVSLSLLLVSAGLFLKTLNNLRGLNPGFEVRNLLSFTVEPTMSRYNRRSAIEYYRRLEARLQTLAGVESTAFAVVAVLQNDEWDRWVTVEGYTPKRGERPDPHVQYCSPGFFETLKIPVLLGRDFTSRDIDGAPQVGIVNQKFVRRYFGTANPIGRHLGRGIDPGTKMDIEIVGVVGDTKYEDMRQDIPEELYTPWQQADFVNGMTVYVRARGNPLAVFNPLRGAVRAVDAGVPMYDLRTLDDQIELSLITERLLAILSTVFGLLASLLAAVGLYAVMAFTVSSRTREIGIRMALGADPVSVVWMVVSEVLLLAGTGAAIGLFLAWMATRLIASQLFGVEADDMLTMIFATMGIAVIAITAGYLPARRATAIDPMTALRWE